ncbi:MAG: hypothetical protein JO317_02960 [Verrucomicrobiae bacterium]|nr:hypothetical protein [Verrucomicrobiae bacterium]
MPAKTILAALLMFLAAAVARAQTTPFTITNNTKGKFQDSQIYWAIIGRSGDGFVHVDAGGNLIPMTAADNDGPGHLSHNGQHYANYFHTVAEAKSVPVPKLGSSRMFISLGSPMYIRVVGNGYAGADLNNPNDPNARVVFDFVEFTIDDRGFHGNTTQVDAFAIPLQIELTDGSGQIRRAGHGESRAALFDAFKRETPPEFRSCVREPYRIVAPASADFAKGRAHARYFDSYIEEVWREFAQEKKTPGGWTGKVVNGVLTFSGPNGKTYQSPKPTSEEAFRGSGVLATNPAVCAAIHRHVLGDPADWMNPAKYYLRAPADFYAKFWHDHSVDKKAYGFCYDDFNQQASFIEAARPCSLNVVVGWD